MTATAARLIDLPDAQPDVPLARYGNPPARLGTTVVPRYLPMLRMPLQREELTRVYPGGAADYLAKARKGAERMVADSWLRASDLDLYLREIAGAAGEAFPG